VKTGNTGYFRFFYFKSAVHGTNIAFYYDTHYGSELFNLNVQLDMCWKNNTLKILIKGNCLLLIMTFTVY
jgi:hypothetical protein